ncbi:1579_t:CDS:1, partial [Racocetra persica]
KTIRIINSSEKEKMLSNTRLKTCQPVFTSSHAWKLLAIAVALSLLVGMYSMQSAISWSHEKFVETDKVSEIVAGKLPWTPFSTDYIPSSCESLPPRKNTSSHKFQFIDAKSKELTILWWRYLTFASIAEMSWETVSQELCPYPPELDSFFREIFKQFARR